MTRGAILFAFNSDKYDYYKMAVAAAKRINHFLNLPVTVVTDENSVQDLGYTFDKTIITVPDKNNKRDWGQWINKGRYKAYELSPYDETLLLDTDYIVNSDKLLKTFDFSKDFCCHGSAQYLLHVNVPQEVLSPFSFNTLWATVIMFKKTQKTKQLFETIEMIQHNFEHYANIHGFISTTFRNDYALTLAARIVNGHLLQSDNIIPWSLIHVGNDTTYKGSIKTCNTNFTMSRNISINGKSKTEYIDIKDMDFHLMGKNEFERFDIITYLENYDCKNAYPLFWAVKNDNIIITRGKTGTRTILKHCDFSCEDTQLSGTEVLSLIKNSNTVHFLIREPLDRFRTGIIEDYLLSYNYSTEHLTDSDINMDEFVNKRINELEYINPRTSFHTGNWLADVKTFIERYSDLKYLIWDFKDYAQLMEYCDIDSSDKNNTISMKPEISKAMIQQYDSLSDLTKNKILEYLYTEIVIYKKLRNIP